MIGKLTCPYTGDQRCQKLAAGHHADDEVAEAESKMNVQRKDWQQEADNEKSDCHHRHDWQQRRDRIPLGYPVGQVNSENGRGSFALTFDRDQHSTDI
jgi:hypothetical protein